MSNCPSQELLKANNELLDGLRNLMGIKIKVQKRPIKKIFNTSMWGKSQIKSKMLIKIPIPKK